MHHQYRLAEPLSRSPKFQSSIRALEVVYQRSDEVDLARDLMKAPPHSLQDKATSRRLRDDVQLRSITRHAMSAMNEATQMIEKGVPPLCNLRIV